jgi:hypothetical protein
MVERDLPPPGMIRATPRGRLLSAALIALAIVLSAVFQFLVRPSIRDIVGAHSTPEAIIIVKYSLIGFAALAIAPAIILIVIGRKILRNRQYPPPNAWVWRDTPVKRGKPAIRIAWTCIITGVLAGVLCAGLVAYIWLAFERIEPQHPSRPGIVILQERSASKP